MGMSYPAEILVEMLCVKLLCVKCRGSDHVSLTLLIIIPFGERERDREKENRKKKCITEKRIKDDYILDLTVVHSTPLSSFVVEFICMFWLVHIFCLLMVYVRSRASLC